MAETLYRWEIRDAVMGKGGLLIDPVEAINVSGTKYTINKLSSVAPDPFRMRDSFLFKPGSWAVGGVPGLYTVIPYSPAQTLLAGITATSIASIGYAGGGDPIAVGDVVAIDSELLLVTEVTAASDIFSAIRGYLGTTAATHNAAAAIFKADVASFRRITNFGYPTNNDVDIDRAFLANSSFVGKIYFLLDPEEMTRVINEALPTLYTVERTTVALVANQNEYALPSGVHTKTQILNVLYRDTTSSTDILESSAPAWKVIEDDNACTLHIITNERVPVVSNTSAIIVWRKYYSPLLSDIQTTTCPRELLIPKVEMEMYTKLFKRHGEAAKRMFGQDMALAEKAYHEARALIIAPAEAREYHLDEPINLPRVLPSTWSWS